VAWRYGDGVIQKSYNYLLSRTLRALDNRCGWSSAGCSALRASQPANAAVNPVSKLKFAAGLAADPQRLGNIDGGDMKLFAIALTSLLLFGCAGSPAWESMQISSTRFEAEKNNANLMNVQIGQSREELLQIMGLPAKREAYQLGNDKVIEFLIYRTSGWDSRRTGDTDSQFTPIAIKENKVSGWGRNYYDNVVRSAVDVTIK
jgi:hypothetical protein